jgi:AraC-like DNA-binding protein
MYGIVQIPNFRLYFAMMLDRYLNNLSVEVEPFALCKLDSGWRLTLPGPPVAMLHFVVEGNGWVISNSGERQRVGANWLAVIPAGLVHSLETEKAVENELVIDCTPDGPPVHRINACGSGPLEMIVGCGTLNIRYGDTFGLFDHLDNMLIVDLSSIPEVPLLYQGILAEQSNHQTAGPVLQGAMMTQILVYMFRELAKREDSTLPWLAALDHPRLAIVLDSVMSDPGAHYTVESLADMANMSRSAFAKAFHDAFDRSPMNFVNHVRLQTATRLLGSGNMPVDKVASRVGFSSRTHFSQVFKKHTGLSPAEFRQS